MPLLDTTCALADLTPALGLLAKVLDAHSALPELAGIECEAQGDNTLILRATNSSLRAAVRLPATVRSPRRALVPGLAFRDLAVRCPGDPVTLVQPDTDQFRMQHGTRRRTSWKVLSHHPLPTFPDPHPEPAPTVLRLDPARVISIPRTHAPVGARAPKAPLQAIAIRPDTEGQLAVLATDGVRVSRTLLNPDGFDEAAAIIPVTMAAPGGLPRPDPRGLAGRSAGAHRRVPRYHGLPNPHRPHHPHRPPPGGHRHLSRHFPGHSSGVDHHRHDFTHRMAPSDSAPPHPDR